MSFDERNFLKYSSIMAKSFSCRIIDADFIHCTRGFVCQMSNGLIQYSGLVSSDLVECSLITKSDIERITSITYQSSFSVLARIPEFGLPSELSCYVTMHFMSVYEYQLGGIYLIICIH